MASAFLGGAARTLLGTLQVRDAQEAEVSMFEKKEQIKKKLDAEERKNTPVKNELFEKDGQIFSQPVLADGSPFGQPVPAAQAQVEAYKSGKRVEELDNKVKEANIAQSESATTLNDTRTGTHAAESAAQIGYQGASAANAAANANATNADARFRSSVLDKIKGGGEVSDMEARAAGINMPVPRDADNTKTIEAVTALAEEILGEVDEGSEEAAMVAAVLQASSDPAKVLAELQRIRQGLMTKGLTGAKADVNSAMSDSLVNSMRRFAPPAQ